VEGREPSAYEERLEEILRDHREFRKHVLPLCAAETPISDFVRSFLTDEIHEKYAMGGPLAFEEDNFIGAEFVIDLHQLTIDLCRDIYGARYADPRPLSGTSAVTNLLMTFSEPGQKIMLQQHESGCHASMAPICRRLGLEIVDIPYDFEHLQFDPDACREAAASASPDFALLAPSDIIYPPPLEAMGFPNSTIVIYDATQTLGLIASGHLPSPLDAHPRVIVSGGTHKTLPGPSCGLLLTQDEEIAMRIDTEVSPKFVRHSHPHHIAGLCATLIEHRAVGHRYGERIREHVHTLSRSLEAAGIVVVQDGGRVSETHQVWLHVPAEETRAVYERALEAGITLNDKYRRLFRDTGIRLGVQEIARYCWDQGNVEDLAGLLARLVRGEEPVEELRNQVEEMARLNVFAPGMTIPPVRAAGPPGPGDFTLT
jgi:glycine hydroxymethyltransferase